MTPPRVPEALPGATDQTTLIRARVTWANTMKAEPVVWAWMDCGDGRLPAGALCLAAGREGTGKSSFAMWLAAQVTQGSLPGSWCGTPRKVFFVAIEDSWTHTIVPRLMAAGADLSLVGKVEAVTVDDNGTELYLPRDITLLEEEIVKNDVALLVIDPLSSTIGSGIDTHNERDTRSALDPLARLADRTGAVVLGIAHFNKSASTDLANLVTGSGAFKNVPRAVLAFVRDANSEERVMTQAKNSLGRDDLPSRSYVMEPVKIELDDGVAETARFNLLGIATRTASEVMWDNRGDPDVVEDRRSAAEWIRTYLDDAGGEANATAVLETGVAAGYNTQTLKNSRKKVADTRKTGWGKDQVTTWRLLTRR